VVRKSEITISDLEVITMELTTEELTELTAIAERSEEAAKALRAAVVE